MVEYHGVRKTTRRIGYLDSVSSPTCLPGSVLAKVDDLAGATEPAVVVHAESKNKQTNKNWVVSNMCFVLTVNLE